MIKNCGAITQALLGTLFTWGLTAAGASLVVIIRGTQRKLLDTSLGFAGGVMIAASYWSLLAPAIEMAEDSKLYGQNGEYAFAPVALGFLIGALFVYGTDFFISSLGVHSPNLVLALSSGISRKEKVDRNPIFNDTDRFQQMETTTIEGFSEGNSNPLSRRRTVASSVNPERFNSVNEVQEPAECHHKNSQWKRIVLLIVAITVHNIPEGLAVGVGFGAIGNSSAATFENASYGQLSGMVEPVFGVLGAAAVSLAQPILPYALAFAAGAMIYVVVDDIIPEANSCGNGKYATWGSIWGFIVMMVLDVGLG
ncbi:zinc transporter ZIP11 isoform X2 [Periplaneta americana]|uniref:zinc transporter ZIP11 isoform X2 n=1 Tax=Periplaneta americana TaxID=6978 RepID=UPI0037E8A387